MPALDDTAVAEGLRHLPGWERRGQPDRQELPACPLRPGDGVRQRGRRSGRGGRPPFRHRHSLEQGYPGPVQPRRGWADDRDARPASWPSTTAGRPARSHWPPWSGSPDNAGGSRSDSRPPRVWSAWTSTRSAAGAPGTAGPPWPCSPTPSCGGRPDGTDPPPTTLRADQVDLQRGPTPVRDPAHPSRR
jgi:hypothetical protein